MTTNYTSTWPSYSSTTELNYSAFFFEQGAWPIVHILIPFQCHLLLQNAKVTVLIICLWETFENFWPAVCNGTYCIVKNEWPAETTGNSVVGDVLQGLTGLLLAKLLLVASGTVRWNLGLRASYRLGLFSLWIKRALQCVVLVPLFVLVDSVIECGKGWSSWRFVSETVDNVLDTNESVCLIRVGAMFVILCNCLLVLFVYGCWLNRMQYELQWFWTCRSRRTQKKRVRWKTYWRLHVMWALCILAIGSASFYDSALRSKVFQSWIHSAVLSILLFIVASIRNQSHRALDVFTCGLYSLCTRRADYYHKNFDAHHEENAAMRRAHAYRSNLDYKR